VRANRQLVTVDSCPQLEEIYLNFPCNSNTDLYKDLIMKCPRLQGLSLSLQDDSLDHLVLLREMRGSKQLKFLKLNYFSINSETLDIICSFPNLLKLTGLKLSDSKGTEASPDDLARLI
jgi:hypothetical protein